MPRKIVREIQEAFEGAPVYLFVDDTTQTFVDRLKLNDLGRWERKRYFVTGGKQCTCLGYMKFEKCKHLAMLNGTFEGKGVGAATACAEVRRLIELLGDHFPADAGEWLPDIESLPAVVTAVTLKISRAKEGVERVVSLRKIGKGTLAVVFKIGK